MTGNKSKDQTRPYHHGDLRAALLLAAEAELIEQGVEGFSLRSVAKRAHVSHAAPAHHFGDINGLLTALAAEGYRRFMAHQAAWADRAGADPAARLIESGLGYIDFALGNPALYRLMFGSDRPDYTSPELGEASLAALHQIETANAEVAAQHGREADSTDIEATWAIVHGLADLLSNRRLFRLASLPAEDQYTILRSIIARNIPR